MSKRGVEELRRENAELRGVLQKYTQDPDYCRSRFAQIDLLHDQRAHDRLKIAGLQKRLAFYEDNPNGPTGRDSTLHAIEEMRAAADVVHLSVGAEGHTGAWYCSVSRKGPPPLSAYAMGDSAESVLTDVLAKVRDWPATPPTATP